MFGREKVRGKTLLREQWLPDFDKPPKGQVFGGRFGYVEMTSPEKGALIAHKKNAAAFNPRRFRVADWLLAPAAVVLRLFVFLKLVVA